MLSAAIADGSATVGGFPSTQAITESRHSNKRDSHGGGRDSNHLTTSGGHHFASGGGHHGSNGSFPGAGQGLGMGGKGGLPKTGQWKHPTKKSSNQEKRDEQVRMRQHMQHQPQSSSQSYPSLPYHQQLQFQQQQYQQLQQQQQRHASSSGMFPTAMGGASGDPRGGPSMSTQGVPGGVLRQGLVPGQGVGTVGYTPPGMVMLPPHQVLQQQQALAAARARAGGRQPPPSSHLSNLVPLQQVQHIFLSLPYNIHTPSLHTPLLHIASHNNTPKYTL